MTKFLTYQGKTLSFSEWANRIGVSKQVIHNRVKSGKSIEEILKPGKLEKIYKTPGKNKGSKFLTYQGVTLSYSEWARKRNIPVSRIAQRVKAGKSLEEILSTEKLSKK